MERLDCTSNIYNFGRIINRHLLILKYICLQEGDSDKEEEEGNGDKEGEEGNGDKDGEKEDGDKEEENEIVINKKEETLNFSRRNYQCSTATHRMSILPPGYGLIVS